MNTEKFIAPLIISVPILITVFFIGHHSEKKIYAGSNSPAIITKSYQPRNFGECVYFFKADNFGKNLATFKKELHGWIVVTAISPNDSEELLSPNGYWVSCEARVRQW